MVFRTSDNLLRNGPSIFEDTNKNSAKSQLGKSLPNKYSETENTIFFIRFWLEVFASSWSTPMNQPIALAMRQDGNYSFT